jgi:hypothetical protein
MTVVCLIRRRRLASHPPLTPGSEWPLQVMLSVGAFALFTLTFLVMRMFKSTVGPLSATGGVAELDPELIARVQKASTDFRNNTHADGWVPCLSLGGAMCDVSRRVTVSDQEASSEPFCSERA